MIARKQSKSNSAFIKTKLLSTAMAFVFFMNFTPNKNKIWVEAQGVVVIEAEEAAGTFSSTGWSKEDSLSNFSGDGYVVWRGKGDWGPESRPYKAFDQPERVLTYRFIIKNPGTYFVKVRNRHRVKDGDNDVWTSVNGSDWGKTYDWQTNEWTLDERGSWAKYQLKEGEHLVELAGRSVGFCVDKIFVFRQDVSSETLEALPKSRQVQN